MCVVRPYKQNTCSMWYTCILIIPYIQLVNIPPVRFRRLSVVDIIIDASLVSEGGSAKPGQFGKKNNAGSLP